MKQTIYEINIQTSIISIHLYLLFSVYYLQIETPHSSL